jgi:hypothetical protein
MVNRRCGKHFSLVIPRNRLQFIALNRAAFWRAIARKLLAS